MKQQSGMVFDIQRFCVHDGPGIRTTVFLKGCPLSCGWCHNPEGIRAEPQIMFNAEKCIGCRACLSVCSHGTHILTADGRRVFHPELCVGCGACARACPSESLTLIGSRMTVTEVLCAVLRDRPFFAAGGGVTFSGGEALMQSEFLSALLRCSKNEGLHTALDTSGCVGWSALESTLKLTNLYLYDIKAFSPALHRKLTGVDNSLILENLRRLDAAKACIWIRLPLIRDLNDGEEELAGTARLLSELSCVERIEMMPYHVLGRAKHPMLGKAEPLAFHAPTQEAMRAHKAMFSSFGLTQVL